MSARVFGAIDIGASSGRVMAGVIDGDGVNLHLMHRFPNGVAESGGHLRWDLTGLYDQVLIGLTALAQHFPHVESIGIDTWAVDYGLLDAEGQLVEEPIAYRDDRSLTYVDRVHELISPQELYQINGLQFLPFNTLYQLAAEKDGPRWARAAHIALLPDLLAYWLTGVLRTEATNASTTGLYDVRSRGWSARVLDRLGIPAEMLPPIDEPGAVRGALTAEVAASTGLAPTVVVTAVGSHDTASAVAAVPATSDRFAYVSSGTWSLAGLELPEPVLTEATRTANFTNEGGIDGTTRFLRNVGGLWLLQESVRTWTAKGVKVDLPKLLAAAAALPRGGPVIDIDDPRFIAPGDMPTRIADAVRERAGTPPKGAAGTIRCILDSLATAYAATVAQATSLSGADADVIHIVGGGSANDLLCRLTAELSGRPVIAGPVEATALGNVLVQARAHGAVPASLPQIRAMLARTQDLRHFTPSVARSPEPAATHQP